MHPRFVAATVALSTALFVSSVATAAQITDVQPASASTDGSTTITITGTGFGAAGNLVTVGASPCAVTSETTEQIECTAPEGSGASRPIRVVDPGGEASPPFPFKYTPPTSNMLTSLDGIPSAGAVAITIMGTNFGPASVSREWTTVVGLACTAGTDPHRQMVCPLPPGQGHGIPVSVRVDGQDSSNLGSLSYDPPTITTVTPTHGRAGGGFAITIRGENFGTANAAVTVGGASCPIVEHDHTALACTLPPSSGAPSDVRVTVAGQASNSAPFSYEPVLSKCDAGKLNAATSYAKCLGKLEAKAAQKGVDPTDAAVTKCDDKFTESCAKAESKFSDCSQPGTCAGLQQTTSSRGWYGWIRGTVN